MATLAITVPAGRGGADIRRLAEKLNELSINVPDQVSTGTALTVTFDNAPATGMCGITIAGGPLAASMVGGC